MSRLVQGTEVVAAGESPTRVAHRVSQVRSQTVPEPGVNPARSVPAQSSMAGVTPSMAPTSVPTASMSSSPRSTSVGQGYGHDEPERRQHTRAHSTGTTTFDAWRELRHGHVPTSFRLRAP